VLFCGGGGQKSSILGNVVYGRSLRAPRKTTLLFFRKKLTSWKTRFLRSARSFWDRKSKKKATNHWSYPKNFRKQFGQKDGSPEICVSGLLTTILDHFLEKLLLVLTTKNCIFFENPRENTKRNLPHFLFIFWKVHLQQFISNFPFTKKC